MRVSFILLLAFGLASVVALAETRVVALPGVPLCGDGLPYSAPQAALDEAAPGDRVVLCAGTYKGGLRVDRSVTLEALNATHDAVIVTPGNRPGVEVRADGVTLRGLRVRGGIPGAEGSIDLRGNFPVVEDNVVENDTAAGILAMDGRNATFRSNAARNNTHGIRLVNFSGSLVTGNHLTGNRIHGVSVEQSPHSRVVGNRFETENAAVMLIRSNDARVADNRANFTHCYGFGIHESSGAIIENNTFGYSLVFGGYIVGYSRNNQVLRNEFHGSMWGHGLYIGSPGNILRDNHIHDNAGHGIWISWFQGEHGRVPRYPGEEEQFMSTEPFKPQFLPVGTLVQGNRVENNGKNGILANMAHGALLANNTVRGSKLGGINVTGATDIRIENNVLESNGQASIRLDGVRGGILAGNRLPGPVSSEVSLVESQATVDGQSMSSLAAPRTPAFGVLEALLAFAAAAAAGVRKR